MCLLNDKSEHSSSSREEEGEDARERSLCIYIGMRSWDGDKANSFPEAVKCPIEMDAIEGDETEGWLT